ncbi:hypothetical protein [Streptomyces pseudogriseolus]|uniref:hypothetical protein n=1 Tax=Streptomyces pseudogriseolus TaxID=36817 RepID=UPI001CE24B90|nr:hypothetical protein [Streptomyces pseudogriseolus]
MAMFRYEPVPRDTGVEEALAAVTHDAAWFLARQYAFGEFGGDDAASPVDVSVAQERHLLDGWHGGSQDDADEWQSYDPSSMVLEELVEEESQDGPDPRLVLAGAVRWRRALAAAGLLALLPAFARTCGFGPSGALAPDASAAAVRDRLPDPVALAPWLERLAARDQEAAARFGAAEDTREALATAAAAWLAWWTARIPSHPHPPPRTWDPHRMEYSFSVRASTLADVPLHVAEYHGGHLDWWAFDAAPARTPVAEAAVFRDERKTIPTPARYGGMPVSRLWEMEDALIDFGSIDASPADLGRLLLVAYATVYENDWFCAPLPALVGSLARVVECTVTDVFGGVTVLAPAAAEDPEWSVYGLSESMGAAAGHSGDGEAGPAPSPWFYRPASLPGGLESPPVESVLFLRDEGINLAWAVEEKVTDRAGEPIDRYARWIAATAPSAQTASPTASGPGGAGADGAGPDRPVRYRVATTVPAHWYPLVPELLDGQPDQEQYRLRLVRLIRDAWAPPSPLGRLLTETDWLHEEEVPRSGVRVERSRQFSRWRDGGAHSWTTRRKRSGTGSGSSGLRFDVLEES